MSLKAVSYAMLCVTLALQVAISDSTGFRVVCGIVSLLGAIGFIVTLRKDRAHSAGARHDRSDDTGR